MTKKISLPVLVTVMCVMISIVLGLFWLNQQKQIKNLKTQKSETKVTRTDYSATARKTLDWIDQQRNETGWYILERGCDFEAKTCDTVWDNREGNKDGLIATWSRLNYYHQTKDPKDLEIVKKDIDLFYEKYPNGVDNALWICKITYDMWKSNLFNKKTKDKLEKICFGSEILNSKDFGRYWKERETKVRNFSMKTGSGKSWDGYVFGLRNIDASLAYSTDLIYRYLWKKDNNLKEAEDYFKAVKKSVDYKELSSGDKCLLGLSSLDLYIFNGKNDADFNFVVSLYDEIITEAENPRQMVTPICGLLIKELYTLTGNQNYLKDLEFYSNILVEFNSDTEVNKIISDSSFYKSDKGLVYAWYKNVVENGLIVELLRD